MLDNEPLWKQFHTEYRTWANMLDRCRNPNHPQFHYWGGKGVAVCERWKVFKNFLADMGCRPAKGYSLERRDSAQGYSPQNCYWATSEQQSNNLKSNIRLTYEGRTLTLAQWAKQLGMTYDSIRARYRMGWPTEAILGSPANKYHKERKIHATSRVLTHDGKTMTVSQWARHLNISHEVLRSRVKYGWDTARILTTPAQKRRRS